jgi:HAE1 family hydrophobic/amphiphilic exporter-1
VYPFIIMFSVPLATVGGFAALRLVNWLSLADPLRPTQQFDTLTMLGFIILIGIVVNNAILIVHQSLNNVQLYGLEPQQALRESVRTRVRPILMTALTTAFGQLPLVLMPGAGSELYRGLGAVMVGGLLVSTVFTIFFVPAVFSLVLDAGVWVRALLRGDMAAQRAPDRRPQPEPATLAETTGGSS